MRPAFSQTHSGVLLADTTGRARSATAGGYSLPLSASLGQAAATLLLEPVRGGNRCLCCSCCFCCSTFRGSGGARGRGKKGAAGGSAAGPLALAAAQLRFVATAAAAAAATASAATVGSGGVSRDGARGPLWREGRAEEEEEEKSTTAEGGGCGVAGEFVGLVEACWASGCLESCVHVLGEAPGPVGCSGQPVNGERTCQCNGGGGGSGSVGGGRDDPWGQLLAASVEEEASALRRAQADALTLLRFVCRATTLCETSALTPPPPPSRRHSSDSPSSPAIPPGNTFGDRGINTAYAKGTSENPGEGGGHDTPGVQAAAEVSAAVRRVLLTKTPLLAGVVRCFMGVVASGSTALSWVAGSSAASEMARVVDPERARRELSGAARVAREACTSLRCILSVDAFHAMGTPPQQQQQQQQQRGGGAYPDLGPRKGWPRIEHPYAVHSGAPVTLASDLLSPGSAVPHAVLTAVGDVLRWPDGPEDARGREVAGLIVQAKTEARRLLPVMLSIPRWRNSLDLSSVEARSLAIVLFEEEVAALSSRGGSSWSERRTARADGDLRVRCLVPLLESSEYLQDLALSSGLIGDLYLALENSLAEIATVGHGRDAIKNAAIHLETLKAGMRRRRRSSPSIPGAAAAPVGGGASATPPGSTRQRKTKTKPPIPIEVKRSSRSPSLKTPPTKLTSNVSSKAAEEKAEATGAGVRKLGDDRPDGSGDEVDHHDGDNENHNNGGGRTGARTPRVSPGPGARPRLRPRPKQRPSPPPASLPSAPSALAPSSDRRVGVGGDTKGGGAYRFRGRDSAAGAGKDATSGGSIPAGASGAGAGESSEVAPAGGKTASRVGATGKAVVGEGPEEERGKVSGGRGSLYSSEKNDPRYV